MGLRDVQSFRIGMRRLLRTPGFTLLATMCLALGLGSVITIFAIVNGLFLKPLPGIERPQELVTLHFEGPTSVPNLADVREASTFLAGVGAFSANLATVREADVAERILAAAVTGDYFGVLGTRPLVGRFFSDEEDGPPGAHPVAVVSHDYWQRRLGADAEALGRTVRVNGRPVSVVGVAPPGFLGTFTGFPVDVWVPLSMAEVVAPGFDPSDRAGGGLELIARMADGATLESVRAGSAAIASRLEAAHPQVNRDLRIEVLRHTGFDEEIRMPVLALVAVLLSTATLVLVIACLNFTNMLLVRSTARTREAAIRRALGVERVELITSLLAENVLLALLGVTGGLLVAQWLSASLSGFVQVLPIRIHLELGLDWRVVGASLVLGMIVAIGTGLVPALRVSGGDLVSALKGTVGGGRGGSRLLRVLVVGQLAGSAALLIIAGLFLQTIGRASAVDPGFRIADLSVVPFLDASPLEMEGREIALFFERMVEEVKALPGVVEAGVGSSVPLAFGDRLTRIEIPGLEPPLGQDGFEASVTVVSPGYLGTLQIPLVEGRDLSPEDARTGGPVALVSEALGQRFWPGEDPVGRRFTHLGAEVEVVGVVGDVSEGLDGVPAATFYLHHGQRPESGMNLFIRWAPGAASGAAAVRAALLALSSDLPTVEPQPVSDFLLLSLLPQRVAGTLGGGLGLAGLLLAALGVYGLVAMSTQQRRREIGIRMAIGASRANVLILVFRDTLWLAAWGVAVGLVIALGAGQLLESLLIGVSPFDPISFAVGAFVVMISAGLATVVPARRAAGAEPMVALTRD